MSDLLIKVTQDVDHKIDTEFAIYVGSENATSLATSTPPGGTEVQRIRAWDDGSFKGGFGADPFGQNPFAYTQVGYGFGEGEFSYGAFGLNDWPRRQLFHSYEPSDGGKCAKLPVGVKAADGAGNLSDVTETVIDINDSPIGARSLTRQGSGTPNEVQLNWKVSPDV